MHLVLCPRCGAIRLFGRRPNWSPIAKCVHQRTCRDVEQVQKTDKMDRLQIFALDERGERDIHAVLAEWHRARRAYTDLRRRQQRLHERHPGWHRLKVLWKARQEILRARRNAKRRRDEAIPGAVDRRQERHPRWAPLIAGARQALQRKGDQIDREPYTTGLRCPRHYMPDELPAKKTARGPRFTKPLPPTRTPFTPLPVALRQAREAAAIVAAEGLPAPKLPTPGIRRRPGTPPPPTPPHRKARRAARWAALCAVSDASHVPDVERTA